MSMSWALNCYFSNKLTDLYYSRSGSESLRHQINPVCEEYYK